MNDSKDYTIFIRNFDSKQVTYDLLLELFTQAGPVQNLTLKEDFAFLEFDDQESVMYACNLLNETVLFGIPLQVKPRNGSCWENVEMIKFPNKNNYDDNDSRNGNSSYNELDYRQNNRSTNKSFIETDYRQNHRSTNISCQEIDFSLNRANNNNFQETGFRQNNRFQMNNVNELNNARSLHHHHVNSFNEPDYIRSNNRTATNNYIELDYVRQNNRYSANNFNQDIRPINNQSSCSNFVEFDKRRVAIEMFSRDRVSNFPFQDRRIVNQDNLWRDRGTNATWAETGLTFNKSYGNYRNRPY